MKIIRMPSLLAAGCLALLATPVLAHPGHGTGLTAGLVHPLSGIDHLLTMLAVGIWSAQIGKRGSLLAPAAFILFMSVGALVAIGGVHLNSSAVDQAIAASLLVIGLLITFAFRMPASAGIALASLFALFHGFAHGAELHAGLSAATYLVGFTATTSLIILAGMILAALSHELRKPLAIRLAGLGLVCTALLLLGGLL